MILSARFLEIKIGFIFSENVFYSAMPRHDGRQRVGKYKFNLFAGNLLKC